jgi:hypothetical protein
MSKIDEKEIRKRIGRSISDKKKSSIYRESLPEL